MHTDLGLFDNDDIDIWIYTDIWKNTAYYAGNFGSQMSELHDKCQREYRLSKSEKKS